MKKFLKQGKLLVLIDGLDEVPTSQLRRSVQNQLQQITENYPASRLILTCRTQIIEVIPVGFTSVEVADFSEVQVRQFVQNWFTGSGKSKAEETQQWEMFHYAIHYDSALRELTMTPVLLSLMCLVLQDEGEIPVQRNWLYQKGVKLLLNKWNDTKQISGWEVGSKIYGKLSLERKEALLTEIAVHKFENPENFVLFQQKELVDQIARFLQLTNFGEGVSVLKAIEAQHGLLIERADELWSFSHLTFQEYFTFQWLIQLPSAQLLKTIANQQWQEAVKQIIKSQQPADRLLQLIKQVIDQSIVNDPKLQRFLLWVFQKSASIKANYKPVAIRAFYLDSALVLARALDFDRDRALPRTLTSNRELSLIRDLSLDRELNLSLSLACDFTRALALALNPNLDRTLALVLRTLDLDGASDLRLASHLKQLRAKLPEFSIANLKNLQQWWQANEAQWVEQLRQAMIEHRNIGHDWQFTDVQIQQLKRYYDINKFLVELMKIEGAVSDDVRAEIEDSLLLPWSELQRRQS